MTTRSLPSHLSRFFLAAVVALGLAGTIRAQEPVEEEQTGPSPVDLARQIRRNMLKIEEDLTKASTHDATRGEEVRKDLEKLVDSMKQRQDQVIKDIDEIVKQIKVGNCGGSGSCNKPSSKSDSNENQKNSKPRDRNQSQQQSKPRDPNQSKGGKPKPKDGDKPDKKKGGGAEDNTRKEQDPGENDQGDPRAQPKPEKAAHINLNEIWGNLPAELRQKLVDKNYDDFTPEYKEQIEEYFKKTGSAPK